MAISAKASAHERNSIVHHRKSSSVSEVGSFASDRNASDPRGMSALLRKQTKSGQSRYVRYGSKSNRIDASQRTVASCQQETLSTASYLIFGTNPRKTMSYTVSTLLLRNLHDVFGEIDPVRRRAAIDEIFHEDAVFYDPNPKAAFTAAATRSTALRG